jgi:hypothetical protein
MHVDQFTGRNTRVSGLIWLRKVESGGLLHEEITQRIPYVAEQLLAYQKLVFILLPATRKLRHGVTAV